MLWVCVFKTPWSHKEGHFNLIWGEFRKGLWQKWGLNRLFKNASFLKSLKVIGQHMYFLPHRNLFLVLVLFISKRKAKRLKDMSTKNWEYKEDGNISKKRFFILCLSHLYLSFVWPLFSIKMFSNMVVIVWLERIWIVGCNLDNWKGFYKCCHVYTLL